MAEINILVKPKQKGVPTILWFKSLVSAVLILLDLPEKCELSLVITSDAVIKKLNNAYRNINRTTDVLSFNMNSMSDSNGEPPLFLNPPDDINHLGEVVISYPRAYAQAIKQEHSVYYELKVLVTHGMLHLVGYDHKKLKDRKLMLDKQSEIVNQLSHLLEA